MEKKDKDLLLKDLSARLPYGVYVHFCHTNIDEKLTSIELGETINYLKENGKGNQGEVFPYLRPMTSMTDDEENEFIRLKKFSVTVVMPNSVSIYKPTYIVDLEDDGDGLNYLYDWLNKYMFDYRGLIEKGLAIEAPKDMYKFD